MNAQTRTILFKNKNWSSNTKIWAGKKEKKNQERHQIRNRMSFRRPAGNKDIDSTERRNQKNALNENSTSLDPFFKRQFITRSRLEADI
jgi:hypothetical protein